MASPGAHTCLGCGVRMPVEDGHDRCMTCLGSDHARMAGQDPAACMNCFILPARVREARARSFPLEPRAYTAQQHPAKRLRVTVPSPAVTTRAQATSRLPTPTLVVGQEEEYMEEISEEEDDVDIDRKSVV